MIVKCEMSMCNYCVNGECMKKLLTINSNGMCTQIWLNNMIPRDKEFAFEAAALEKMRKLVVVDVEYVDIDDKKEIEDGNSDDDNI